MPKSCFDAQIRNFDFSSVVSYNSALFRTLLSGLQLVGQELGTFDTSIRHQHWNASLLLFLCFPFFIFLRCLSFSASLLMNFPILFLYDICLNIFVYFSPPEMRALISFLLSFLSSLFRPSLLSFPLYLPYLPFFCLPSILPIIPDPMMELMTLKVVIATPACFVGSASSATSSPSRTDSDTELVGVPPGSVWTLCQKNQTAFFVSYKQ